MRPLLALLLLAPCTLFAQLPDYVPTNNLVAWYPLDSSITNAADSSSYNGVSFNGSYIANRNGEPNSAIGLPGSQILQLPLNPAILSNEFTLAFWVYTRSNSIHNEIQIAKHNGPGRANFGLSWSDRRPYTNELTCAGTYGDCGNSSVQSTPLNSWFHLVYVIDGANTTIYVDGTETAMNQGCTLTLDCSDPTMSLWFGGDVGGGATEYFNGDFDDIGIWDGILSSQEVLALYIGTPPEYGCTDSTACNFDAVANSDDGSCEYGCLYCGENTVWDTTLQACVGISVAADTVFIEPEACTPSCGEGTVWDPVNEECIIAIPADLNYDGCVSVNDLLLLLAVHGTCPPYPEWPDEPTDTTWACGDPLPYHGYDYATVQIGDQCWFAENLRTESFQGGSAILEASDFEAWVPAGELGYPAYCHIPDSLCLESECGFLYNRYAVDNFINICPTEWHVPTDSELQVLEVAVGMNETEAQATGFRGTQEGTLLKSSSWDGSDNFGFNALPVGIRSGTDNTFADVGSTAHFWCRNTASNLSWYRALYTWEDRIYRPPNAYDSNLFKYGFSVRCVKD